MLVDVDSLEAELRSLFEDFAGYFTFLSDIQLVDDSEEMQVVRALVSDEDEAEGRDEFEEEVAGHAEHVDASREWHVFEVHLIEHLLAQNDLHKI